MKYDFTTIMDRHGKDSIAVDFPPGQAKEGYDVIPMWVADMNFPTCPTIQEAVIERVKHPAFGYFRPTEEYFDSIIAWQKNRNHVEGLEAKHIGYENGVLGGVGSAIGVLCSKGDNILVHSPTYIGFTHSVEGAGYHLIQSPLKQDENGVWRMDYEDMEKKIVENNIHTAIFCNPHNPIGKIWDKETLQKIGDLCAKHHVTVLSDEIHCDITNPQKEYIPFASVSKTNLENTIMCIAPTKAFNMAGMQTACIVVANEVLRHKVNRGINTDEVAEPNSFAICATKAAFNQSEDWLNKLNQYIQNNKDYAISFIQKEMNDVYVVPTEATYLLWIDCHKVCMDSVELTSFIREKTGLYVSDGLEYGENGKAFIRMNVACPFERLKDGLNRFKEGIYLYQNK